MRQSASRKTTFQRAALPIAILSIQYCAAMAQLPVPANGVISQPGAYYLTGDLLVNRSTGIDIQANNVALDLRGHELRFTDTPRPGTYGITAFGRTNVHITNGSIGAFWFDVHASQTNGLKIDHVSFDDIPYIGINAASSDNVTISDNVFSNFRYDLAKPVDPYVIGVNIGAEDSVITRNRFDAQYTLSNPSAAAVETVLVLFSADVSLRSVVTHNIMTANTPLDRSYGVWVASNAHIAAAHNTIHNMRYGITLASSATSLVSYNDVSVGSPLPGITPLSSTFGVFALTAEQVRETGNRYTGHTHPTFLPTTPNPNWDNANVAIVLDINDLSKSFMPGIGYDQINFPGVFSHGGSVNIDLTRYIPGSDYISDLKLIGWNSEVESRSFTAVKFTGGAPLPFEFRSDGLYLTGVGINVVPEPASAPFAITCLLAWGGHRSRRSLSRASAA